jgi:DNA-binding response OmpR family regulator
MVDDDGFQLGLAQGWLVEQGHAVVGCSQGERAVRMLDGDSFDLVILDWMMPGMNGEALLAWIRRRHGQMPVMFATARDEEEEIARMLEAGADDYLVKPLRRREFVARVAALGRRTRPETRMRIKVGPYEVDHATGAILLNGQVVPMTPRMRVLAGILFRHREQLISRRRLYEEIWGHLNALDTRTLDTHVSRVRLALELDGRHGWRLASVYQHGYRLEPVLGSN